MTTRIVVLGAGYAGVGVIMRLEQELDDQEAELVWVSDQYHHFVLHEAHRIIRKPYLQDVLTIPVERIKSARTEFRRGEVEEIDDYEREIRFSDGSSISFDFVVDALGSRTEFYDIDGLEDHALTLKSLSDALEIHHAVTEAAREATVEEQAQVVVGGAGLSGIQSAGEIAALRNARGLPLEIHLVEAMDEIYPGYSYEFQGMIEDRLEARGVHIHTGSPITGVDEESIHFDERNTPAYDVLLWTGGITGHDEKDDPEIDLTDNRIEVEDTFQSGDQRLFALGDAAVVDQGDDPPPPPTAQAAWNAAEVAGANVARAIRGRPLESWEYDELGTVVSIGDSVVAHGVPMVPVSAFGGLAASTLKKVIGVRWLASAGSWRRALQAWPDL